MELTKKEKDLLLKLIINAARYSEPLFYASASCLTKSNVGVLNSLSKKGAVERKSVCDDAYYEFTADGLASAQELGYLDIVRPYADWMYGK